MSDLTRNPHYKSTLESISDFGEYTVSAEGLTDATIIWQGLVDQAQATLALAYEQRTANLIALAQLTMHEPAHEDYDMAAIYERLGLETGAEE